MNVLYSVLRKQHLLLFSHLADTFIQSDLQMRTTEAVNCSIKTDPKLKA